MLRCSIKSKVLAGDHCHHRSHLGFASAGVSDHCCGLCIVGRPDRRWQTVDVEVITDEDEPNEQGNIELELEVTGGSGYARRYINSDGKNWARVWTWGFGDVFGGGRSIPSSGI